MFSCCLPTSRGAGPTGAQSQRHYCSCRQCFSPLFRSFWSWGRRHQQSCTPETVNELAGDFNDSNSLDKGQVSQATQDQCCSEASSLSPDEACTMLALREGAVQRWGHSLLLSFPDRSLSNVTTMCSIYQMFTSAQQVLDQQFPSTLCPILGTWPEQTRQDIGQSLHTAHVEVKGAYVHVTWHDRDLNTHAPVPLRQRQLLQLTEAEAEAAEPAKEPPMEREATLALHQPSPSGSEPASPPPAAPELEQGLLGYGWSPGPEAQTAGPSACLGVCTPAVSAATEPTPAAEASCQPKKRLKEKEPDLLDFPPKLVAEQLTYMDAVSSWAPRAGGQGRLFSSALRCPIPAFP
ncbi:uncharacterized protein LOC123392541 [Mustela putorius furo]|uniref:Uncharacterized protein LOC123392541 n=1 Tax=Mustela putorius furo TaxID=9669 RepID=A0A8U0S7Q6_MUSPF|nr:uncharacterized protein LOC123392541 [Mustela putorius furo]